MTEQTRRSHFQPSFLSVSTGEYETHLARLLTNPQRAETIAAFAYNNQPLDEDSIIVSGGEIEMDAYMDTPSLHLMGILDIRGEHISGFGKYVVQSLTLDPADLAEGKVEPKRL